MTSNPIVAGKILKKCLWGKMKFSSFGFTLAALAAIGGIYLLSAGNLLGAIWIVCAAISASCAVINKSIGK